MNARDRKVVASLALLTVVVVGFVSFRLYQFVHYVRTEGVTKPAGQVEFDAANRLLHVRQGDSGPVAFGNSEQATALAATFSRMQLALRQAEFEGGKPGVLDELSTRGEFLTYCRLDDDACVFLVHVPEMRQYTHDAKTALHDLAWQAAQRVLRDVEPRPQELVVALRGALLYEAILIGPADGTPVVHDAAMRELKRLYPYFVERHASE